MSSWVEAALDAWCSLHDIDSIASCSKHNVLFPSPPAVFICFLYLLNLLGAVLLCFDCSLRFHVHFHSPSISFTRCPPPSSRLSPCLTLSPSNKLHSHLLWCHHHCRILLFLRILVLLKSLETSVMLVYLFLSPRLFSFPPSLVFLVCFFFLFFFLFCFLFFFC